MAKDVADVLGNALGRAAKEAAKTIVSNHGKSNGLPDRVTDAVTERIGNLNLSNLNLSGSKGLAAGAGLATIVPLAAKGAGKLVRGMGGDGGGPMKKAGEKVGEKVGGAAKKAAMKGGGSESVEGVGKGRRMPVQQDIDIGVPIADVYKHWTDYDEWPSFMHRLQNVSKEDDEHVTFKTKIWGISKEFRAEIVDERENERIKWKVTDGVTHAGVVTFHELGPRLTRVELNLDVEPGSLIEKAARGMRHVKRAVRADMARFKAYVLMEEDGSSASESESSSQAQSSSRTESSSQGRSRSSSSGARKRSTSGSTSSGRKRSTSAGGRKQSSSGSGRKQSTSASGRKQSASGGRKRSASSGRKQSSNGGQRRSSSSRTRATSSNGSSSSSSGSGRSTRASSNGRSRSGSAKKRASTRS